MISMDSEGGVYNLLGARRVQKFVFENAASDYRGRHRNPATVSVHLDYSIPMWSSSSKPTWSKEKVCGRPFEIADYYPANKPR